MFRVLLLVATNIGVMLVLSLMASLFGLDRYLTANGLNLTTLLMFSALMGFGGAFISLLMSKMMAKMSTGARVIEQPSNETEQWLVNTVAKFAGQANIAMPEVAIYEGEPNAFATGATRNNSLVAVSTGLLQVMNRREAEAVIGHEVSHIANGDMVTLTLVQGVVNTFVFFLARVIGFLVDSMLRRGADRSSGPGIGYYVTVMFCQIVLGVLASMVVAWFSRQREYRADAGAANLMGSPAAMVAALKKLGQMQAGELPQAVATAGINNRPGWMNLLSSHPPLEQRIAALNQYASGKVV